MEEVTVTVTGCSGSGKTTIATIIRDTLKAQDIDVKLIIGRNEMIPCPTTLRQRLYYLMDEGLKVTVIEEDFKP